MTFFFAGTICFSPRNFANSLQTRVALSPLAHLAITPIWSKLIGHFVGFFNSWLGAVSFSSKCLFCWLSKFCGLTIILLQINDNFCSGVCLTWNVVDYLSCLSQLSDLVCECVFVCFLFFLPKTFGLIAPLQQQSWAASYSPLPISAGSVIWSGEYLFNTSTFKATEKTRH